MTIPNPKVKQRKKKGEKERPMLTHVQTVVFSLC